MAGPVVGLTPTQYAAALKEFFTPEKLKTALFTEFPFLEEVRKIEKAEGKYFRVPVQIAPLARRSADYATAYDQTVIQPIVDFQVPYLTDYAIVTIEGTTIRRARTDKGTFADAIKLGMEDAMNALRKSMAIKLVRSGSGKLTQLANTATNVSTLQLLNTSDSWLIEKGDYLQFSASTTDGAALRSGGLALAVSGVTEQGLLTMSGVVNSTITDFAVADYIYHQGDAQNNASAGVVMTGLQGWAPATTAALSTTFMNVLRSEEQRRLAGVYVSNTGNLPIDEQIQDGVQRLQTNKGDPSVVWMNPVDLSSFSKTESAKIHRSEGGTAKVGFTGISIVTSKGLIPVKTCPSFPAGRAYAVDMKNIALVSLGSPVGFLDEDGQTIRKIQGKDRYEMSLGGEMNLVCLKAPGQVIAAIDLY